MSSLGLDSASDGLLIAAGFVSITQFIAVFPAMTLIDKVGKCSALSEASFFNAEHYRTEATTNEYASPSR